MKEIILIKVGKEYYPTNCYIVKDEENNAVIIDPGYDKDKIIHEIVKRKLNVLAIILTHGHGDHIGALEDVMVEFNCNVVIHENDIDCFIDDEKAYFSKLNVVMPNISKEKIITCKDKDILNYGKINLEVIHTPGHTNGSICLYENSMNILLTGDTIFQDCYGRCDLKSSSIEDMGKSIELIFNRFSNICIYPGHEGIVDIDSIKKRIRLLYAVRRRD